MKRYPSLPPLADAPAVLDGGHLWIQELIDGSLLRFGIGEDGTLAFGDSRRVFDDDPPLALRPAVRHVRESLDWETLYDSATDVTGVTFFGVAPLQIGVDYDFDRMPPFLGTDVWTTDADALLKPDVVERVYERIGLDPVTVVRKEVTVRDFDAATYEVPQSTWADQQAAGVVLRTKQGDRAKLLADTDGASTPPDAVEDPLPTDPDEVVDRYLTDDLLTRVEAKIESDTVGVERLHERALETAAREHYHELDRADLDLDRRAIRTAARERVRSWL